MFDLDLIEKDWQENSFILNDIDVREIYKSEGIMLKDYNDKYKKYYEEYYSIKLVDPEERLLNTIFGTYDEELEKKYEEQEKLRSSLEKPTKKYLSEENIKKVVEGTLYIVFESTRIWYDLLNKKVSLEVLYYLSLDGLISTTKYLLHPKKPLFKYYAERNIRRNILKYVARINHISYNEAYEMFVSSNLDVETKEKEELLKPSKLFYQTKDILFIEEYDKIISSEQFMIEYNNIINSLDSLDKDVMHLVFDSYGNRCMSFKEIADYLGIEENRVSNIKRKVMRKLKRNIKICEYHNN